jgi:hypothetical protein
LDHEKSPYLPIWELDTTSKADKERYLHLIDKNVEAEVEKKISQYIQENLSFSILEITSKDDRMYFEARLIGTVSGCNECVPSDSWLGQFSPKEKIRISGLWQVMKLYSEPLDESELSFITQALIRD